MPMRWIMRITLFAIAAVCGVTTHLSAQNTQYGQNKPKDFSCETQRLTGERADYYQCPEAEHTVRYLALEIVERDIRELADSFGVTLPRRLQYHFYPGRNQFKATNLTWSILPDGVGGFTEAENESNPKYNSNRLVFPFEGDYAKFSHVTRHEIVHRFQTELAYKNGIGLQEFPLWWIGQASIISKLLSLLCGISVHIASVTKGMNGCKTLSCNVSIS